MNQDVMKLLELVENEGTNHHGTHHLDFSNQEHLECFFEMFGGKEHMEKEYPDLYALALKTAHCETENGVRNGVHEDGETTLQNASMVHDAYSNKDVTGAAGFTGLTTPAKRLYQSITLLQDDEVQCRKRGFYNNVEMEDIACQMDTSQLKSSSDDVTCVYNVTWHDANDGLLKSDTSVKYKIKPSEDYVTSTEVAHPCYYHGNSMSDLPTVQAEATEKQPVSWPRHPSSGRTGTVNVAYARSGSPSDVIDYAYREIRKGGNNEVLLDVQGKVTLADGYEYDKLVGVNMLLDIVGDGLMAGDGVIEYNVTPKDGIHVYAFTETSGSQETKGFYFVLPTDWNAVIPDSSFAASKRFFFELQIEFKCKNCSDVISVYVTSTDMSKSSTIGKIPEIKLKWGCLEKDAMVEMSDGSTKKISEIVKGDQVKTVDGSSKVTDVTTGTEEELIYLKVEGYESILGASMTHTFMKEN